MTRRVTNAEQRTGRRRDFVHADGREYATARDAIEAAAAAKPVAIRFDGRNLVVTKAEADRMAAAGIAFAYLCDHDGRIVTVPVND
ncbi:MAG TPA: hypothetical protein VKE40_20605 [Gemmataceae bacterium]|nr:hypothetical protein [Gemmataceae bacterium]